MTIKLQILATGLGLTLALTGCKKKDEGGEAEQGTKVTETQPTETETPEPVKKTAADHVKFVQEGWAEWNAGDLDKLMQRYTEDATCEQAGGGMPAAEGRDACKQMMQMFRTAFPDGKGQLAMTFANDERVVVVALLTGTHQGPFMGMEPTNKKFGMMSAHVFNMNDEGLVAKQSSFSDSVTMMGQLGIVEGEHRPAMDSVETTDPVIAAGDEQETANAALVKQWNDAMASSTPKWDMLAENFVSMDYTMPKDMEGVEPMKQMYEMWSKAMTDSKFETEWTMPAGEYVVQIEKYSGKNTGPMPAIGLKKATNKEVSGSGLAIVHIADGKIDKTWNFMNTMDVAVQLGLMEPPAMPTAAGDADTAGAAGAADEAKK